MVWLILFGFLVLAYLYGGYLLLLKMLAQAKTDVGAPTAYSEQLLPFVTVLITVFNEKQGVVPRIQNVLDCDYPSDRLEILVASDGSTDGTDELVTGIGDSRVRLFRPVNRRGKTDTQNQAIVLAIGEIVIFTDADTRFDPLFIRAMVGPFADDAVGGVDGHLLFLGDETSGVSRSQSFYWRQELQIRTLESRLGIMAVASGACMAVRRSLFRPMLATVGEDCLIPLDIVSQGYKMIHAVQALAFDRMEQGSSREFKTRVRMTLRNWQGTWSYPELLNPLRHPYVAWGLWSHKLLRWLSPVFLMCWLFGSLMVLGSADEFAMVGVPGALFLFAGLAGALRVPLPGVSMVYSFFLANVGFLVGLLKVIRREKIIAYK